MNRGINIEHFGGRKFELIKDGTYRSEKEKLIYFKIGRVAGTSIFRHDLEKRFPDFESAWDVDNKNKKWVGELTRERLKEYFLFAFVRNPFDRVVSIATYFGIDIEYFIKNIDRYVPVVNLKRISDISEFLDNDLEGSKERKKSIFFHSLPCSLYTHFQGIQVTDFIGRFENLQEDFDNLCCTLNIEKTKLRHLRKTEHKNYRDYYNSSLIKIVRRRYKDDIKLLGYEF